MLKSTSIGFSLTELLIALMIIGEIATFTIPKVLVTQQNDRYEAVTKEAAAMISEAYTSYQLKNGTTAGFNIAALTPYINYVAIQTIGSIDGAQTQGAQTCDNSTPCFKLHSGATLIHFNSTFVGTASTNSVKFRIDPDGKVTDGGSGDTSATAPGKAAAFFLFTNGRITDGGNIPAGTLENGGSATAAPTLVPPWFSW